jgi:hypothetical protein
MRQAWINSPEALRTRMINPAQVDVKQPEAEMPPYMESLLAHLRVLVGVPFDYLVADARLLPDESIRFFYLDRSWTDRLVDGAIAVGKIGSREQSHHQAHAAAVSQQLDLTERIVRQVQIGKISFPDLKTENDKDTTPADIVTGFLLRSAAVSGWPHMDVRAYDLDIPEKPQPLDPADPEVKKHQLVTLRLELLSPSVMLALFQGIPHLVYLEEQHHAIQFGINDTPNGFFMDLRSATGFQVPNSQNPDSTRVPVRAGNPRVVHVAALRKALSDEIATHPTMPPQNGSANFAVEVLQPPWRQRFEGTQDNSGQGQGNGVFVGGIVVAKNVLDPATQNAFKQLITINP